MLKTLCLVALAAASVSAEPTLESLSASSALSMPAMPRFVPASRATPASLPAPARLPDGTMSGSIGGIAMNLTFSRRAGKISGALEQQGVSFDYTGDGDSAEGAAFGMGADYSAKTNEDGSFAYTGHVRGMAFSYTYSDVDHYVRGAIGGRTFDITFDPVSNTASGAAGGQDFKLELDPVSGKLTGIIEGQRVELTLVNEGLGNFLENIFLFVK